MAQAGSSGAQAEAARAGSGAGASSSGTATHSVVKREVAIPLHPLAKLGGHQAPLTGRVGGAMGAGGAMHACMHARTQGGWVGHMPGKQQRLAGGRKGRE